MTIQTRLQELAKKHAPEITSARGLAVAMGLSSDDWGYVEQLWEGEAKQLSFARLKAAVRVLNLDPGNVTLAEFFTFDGIKRKKSFAPTVATITDASLGLRTRQLAAKYGGKALFTCFGSCSIGGQWLSEKGETIPNVRRWRANGSSAWSAADTVPVNRRVQIEAKAIMTPYALQSACGFSAITVAIGLWKGTPKKVSLDNLEKLIRGLAIDPAVTSLAELFDFGL